MKFAIASVSYWDSIGMDSTKWRKSLDGTKALCHLSYAERLGINLHATPEVAIYDNVDTEFEELLNSPEWSGTTATGDPDSFSILNELNRFETKINTAVSQKTTETTNLLIPKIEANKQDLLAAKTQLDQKTEKNKQDIVKTDTKLEGYITTNDKDKLSLTTQLQQTVPSNPFPSVTKYALSKKAMVTFIDDDAKTEAWDILKPISEEKGIPFVSAAITGGMSELTKDQLLHLQNVLKWEIASHTVTHGSLAAATGKTLDYELSESKRALTAMGLKVNHIVYPGGAFSEESTNRASDYYRSGVTTGAKSGESKVNTIPVKNFELKRVPLGSYTQSGMDTLDYYKSQVDEALAIGGWLIFMVHSEVTPPEQIQHLRDTIDYVKSLNVDIVTLEKGFQRFGNKLELKSGSTEWTLTNSGEMVVPRVKTVIHYENYDTEKPVFNAPITSYRSNSLVYSVFGSDAVAGYPNGSAGGLLVTVTTTGAWRGDNYQFWTPYDNNRLFKRRVLDNGTWGPWEEYASVATVKTDTEKLIQYTMEKNKNTYNATTPIASFPLNKVTVFTVDNSARMGFPGDNPGMIITYRFGSNGWDRQEFKRYASNETWSRYTNESTGAWTPWVKTSVV